MMRCSPRQSRVCETTDANNSFFADLGGQGEARRRKGLGCQVSEAHLLGCVVWFIFATSCVTADSGTGKILKDEDTVASYKIKETDFVVCMVMKVWLPGAAICACVG
jgi:hypothetical protein